MYVPRAHVQRRGMCIPRGTLVWVRPQTYASNMHAQYSTWIEYVVPRDSPGTQNVMDIYRRGRAHSRIRCLALRRSATNVDDDFVWIINGYMYYISITASIAVIN